MPKRRSALVAALGVAAISLSGTVGARAADSESITKTSGMTTATLRWQPSGAEYDYSVTQPALTIARGGTVVFEEGITDVCGTGCVLTADRPGFAAQSNLKVADIDGDGEPEVLVDTFSGGAHCCTTTRVYSYRPATATYTRDPSYQWLDADYELKDLDGDGKLELVGSDASFSYAFSSYAGSQFPPLVESFSRDANSGKGSFKDVTRRYPAVVAPHAARMLKLIRKAKKSNIYEIQGAIAAYVADEYLLGKGPVGLREISRDRAKGLTTRFFRKDLLKFLAQLGYR